MTSTDQQPGPGTRTLRTILQTVVAVLVAVPAAISLVPIPDRYDAQVGFVVGISAGLVVLVTAGWNAVESRRGAPLIGDGPGPT